MAQIDMGRFGFATAEPQRATQIPGNIGSDMAAATSNLGNTLQGVVQQRQRIDAATSLAALNNDLYDIHDQVSRDVTDGAIPAQDADSEFQKRVGDARQARTQGLSPAQISAMEPDILRTSGALSRSLQGVALKRTQSEIGSSILEAGEQFGRAAMRDLPESIKKFDGVVDIMGPQAGWNPEQITKVKQGFRETSTFNFANATLEGAAQSGDMSLIVAARERIQGPEGEAIDPAKRTALITKAYAYENGIIASGVREAERLQREAEAREKRGREALDDAQKLMLNGRYLSTEYVSRLADVTAGTSAAPAVQELVRNQAEVAGFASLPISQQTNLIERRLAAGSTPGVGTNPDAEKLTAYMTSIRDSSAKAYAENPWTAAQERGVIERAPQISLNNIQDAQSVLSARMQQIDTVEVAAERKISPLQPQEAEQIARIVRMLPPDQQSGALASFGELVPDADRLAAMANQMHDKDRSLGLAMMLAGDKTTQGRYASELLLRGQRALKDKSIMVDAARETGWRGQIANEVGDAFPNNEVRDAVIESAYLINAGFLSEGGSSDPRRALRLAVGSIIDYNGRKLPLPRGMEEGDFEKRIKAVQASAISAQTSDGKVYSGKTGIPIAQFMQQLPDATLELEGAGRYNVRSGGTYLTNSAGKRITIQVLP